MSYRPCTQCLLTRTGTCIRCEVSAVSRNRCLVCHGTGSSLVLANLRLHSSPGGHAYVAPIFESRPRTRNEPLIFTTRRARTPGERQEKRAA